MQTSLSATADHSCGEKMGTSLEHSEAQLILLPAGLAKGSPGPLPQGPLHLPHRVTGTVRDDTAHVKKCPRINNLLLISWGKYHAQIYSTGYFKFYEEKNSLFPDLT